MPEITKPNLACRLEYYEFILVTAVELLVLYRSTRLNEHEVCIVFEGPTLT